MNSFECAIVASDIAVFAYDNGEFLVHRVSGLDIGSPVFTCLLEESSAITTRAMLSGAIYAAQKAYGSTRRPNRLSLSRVIFDLAGNYHTATATPQLFRQTAKRFRAMGRTDLAEFAEVKAKEETGHDHLALKDLTALDLPALDVVQVVKPARAMALVDKFKHLAELDNPVGCFGYAYVLERLAMRRGLETIDAVQSVCPVGVDATRCLRVHSAIGPESSHVADSEEFLASLPPSDRLATARAAYETMAIMARPTQDDRLSDSDIQGMLRHVSPSGPFPGTAKSSENQSVGISRQQTLQVGVRQRQ